MQHLMEMRHEGLAEKMGTKWPVAFKEEERETKIEKLTMAVVERNSDNIF